MPLKVLGGTRSSAKSRAFGPGGNSETNTKPLFDMRVKSLKVTDSISSLNNQLSDKMTKIMLQKPLKDYGIDDIETTHDQYTISSVTREDNIKSSRGIDKTEAYIESPNIDIDSNTVVKGNTYSFISNDDPIIE